MADQLHQMTMEYVPEQDRVMFRVSTTGNVEHRLWLTRRLISGLWKAMVGTFAAAPEIKSQPAPKVKKALMSLKHQQAVQGSDFSQPRKEVPAAPSTTGDYPLVTGVTCKILEQQQRQLTFRAADGKEVTLKLSEDMMHALCHLMQQATEKAQWGLGLTIGDAAGVIATDEAQLH